MTNSSVVVEMKTDKLNEEDVLLNKKNATEQVRPIGTANDRGLKSHESELRMVVQHCS